MKTNEGAKSVMSKNLPFNERTRETENVDEWESVNK